MKAGIVNENNKEKMITLFEALSDVLNDKNICCGECKNCCYNYLMVNDFFNCMFCGMYYYVFKELIKDN